jgi:hypothetical protein
MDLVTKWFVEVIAQSLLKAEFIESRVDCESVEEYHHWGRFTAEMWLAILLINPQSVG